MEDQYQCRFCLETYEEIQNFLDHFETHMNEDQKEPNGKQQTAKHSENKNIGSKLKSYICSSCGKRFSAKY